MKYKLSLIFLLFSFIQKNYAQLATSFGGKGMDQARFIKTDGLGAIYVGGMFADTVDFQTNEKKDLRANRGKGDIFVVRYSELEQYRNVLQIGGTGGDTIRALHIDNQNYIYVAGSFEETCDFDPRPSTMAIKSKGKKDAFLAKYDSLGTPIWVKTFGDAGDDQIFDVDFDQQGNIYIVGSFEKSIYLDGQDNLSRIVSHGKNDGFFAKYNAQGDYKWALPIGSRNQDILPQSEMGIAVGENNDIYVAGTFVGSIDFNLRGSVYQGMTVKNHSVYVARYNSNGIFLKQAARIEGESSPVSLGTNGLHISKSGKVVITGNFSKRANFGTDRNPRFLESRGGQDAFITQLKPHLEHDWVINIGGKNDDLGHGVSTNLDEEILVTGQFRKSAVIGAGGNPLKSKEYGAYLIKLNSNGGAMYSRVLDSKTNFPTAGYDVANIAGKNILWAGSFAGSTDVDPSQEVITLNSFGKSDVFIVKYDQTGNIYRPSNCSGTGEKPKITSDSVICLGQSVQINVDGASQDPGITYRFQQSIDGINFKNFGEISPRNVITFPNLQRDIYFRAIVSCVNSEKSDTTTVFPIKVSNVNIHIGKSPIFAMPRQKITLGETPLATGGTGKYTYSWTPRSYVNNDTIPNPTFEAQSLGVYQLQLTVRSGSCEQVRTIQVRVTATALEDENRQTSRVTNFPNPFSKRTQIAFWLQKRSNIRLCVYQTHGDKIYTSKPKTFSKGQHTFLFENPNLNPGVYYYQLIGDQSIKTGKMVIIP